MLSGASGDLAHLADAGRSASDPTIPRDSRWLAYLETPVTSSSGGTASRLCIASADGHGAREIAGVNNAAIVGRSPTSDEIAVVDSPLPRAHLPSTMTTTLDVITPPGRLRTVFSVRTTSAKVAALYGAAWSPNGEALAVATTGLTRRVRTVIVSIDLGPGRRRPGTHSATRQCWPVAPR